MAELNKRAQAFQEYLDKKDPKAFQVQAIEGDRFHTAVFRSHVNIDGTPVVLVVLLDDTAFGMIRVLLAPKALKDNNKEALEKMITDFNQGYKAFKFYLDPEGSLILDLCVVFENESINGVMFYALFDLITKEMGQRYKEIMKTIWE